MVQFHVAAVAMLQNTWLSTYKKKKKTQQQQVILSAVLKSKTLAGEVNAIQ
jgi:hypothetical protein